MLTELSVVAVFAISPKVAVGIVVFMIAVFSIILHEVAHAAAALWCGDPTAYRMGRITLNPIDHIDPFMTILLPAILFLVSEGTFLFGGAKPVPVNYYNLKNIRRNPMIVAGAGPATNLVLAVVLVLLSNLWWVFPGHTGPLFWKAMCGGASINIVLAVFNLVPIPPLDGSRIVTCLLPDEAARRYASIEPYGMFIIMALLFMGGLSGLIVPVLRLVWGWLEVLLISMPPPV